MSHLQQWSTTAIDSEYGQHTLLKRAAALGGKSWPHASTRTTPQSPGRRTTTKGATLKPVANRTDKYDAKYVATTVSLKVASQLSTMKSGFAAPGGMADLYAKEVLIQAALNAVTPSVPTIHYPFYLSFGRELWALGHRGIGGAALADAAHATKTKWLAFGLTGATMDVVAAVFSITGI
jgi:hypothetical protein